MAHDWVLSQHLRGCTTWFECGFVNKYRKPAILADATPKENALKKNRWLPTGFSIAGIAGVSGSLIKSDAQICQELVGFVEDKRFMYENVHREHSDHLAASVLQIRAYAVNAQYLPSNKTTQQSIKAVAAACRQFLASSDSQADPRIRRIALTALRKRIGVEIVALSEKYDLQCDLDLAEFREDALEVLNAWMRKDPWPTR